jgi:hypothetical protein
MARPGLTAHRKFKRLSRALGSPMLARGALELLWDACYEHGDEYVGTADDIEATVGWTGEPGALARALIDCGQPEGRGFIEPVPDGVGGYRVHDLWHHAPDYVAKRRKRELERIAKVGPAPNGGQCPPSSDRQDGDRRTPSPSPAPSPSPGKSVSSAPPAAREPDDSPVLLEFPTIGPDGQTWCLRRRQVDEWKGHFPGLDVMGEMRKALVWVTGKSGRRKTARGMTRFLSDWLIRAVDRPGRSAYASGRSRPDVVYPQAVDAAPLVDEAWVRRKDRAS